MPFTTLISVESLRPLLESGDIALFDCRFDLADPQAGATAWRAGHIPGARYLHLDDDLAGPATGRNGRHPLPDPEVFAATLRAAGVKVGQQVVAYDDAGGPYAARLWWLLGWLGHKEVAVLDGGLQAWTASGGALEAGDPPIPELGTFGTGRPPWKTIIDVADVQASLTEDWNLIIVDARTPERFRGDPNPLDPVAGHIPGAVNRFFKDNLSQDGLFKAPEVLEAEWSVVLEGRPAGAAIMQCGSGVTACHNILALEVARMPWAKLYPGSWSEWIADPSRPVARGLAGKSVSTSFAQ